MKAETKKELVRQLKYLIRRIEKDEIDVVEMSATNEVAQLSEDGFSITTYMTGWKNLSFRYLEKKQE